MDLDKASDQIPATLVDFAWVFDQGIYELCHEKTCFLLQCIYENKGADELCAVTAQVFSVFVFAI